MDQQTNSVYIPKEKAAKRLGLGPRRVLELAQQGHLGKQTVWNEKTHRHQTLISEADVEKYLEGGRKPATNGAIVQETALIRMAEEISQIRQVPMGRPKYEDWQWLSLEEAAAEVRLPVKVLEKLARAGDLAALKVGRGDWRVRFSAVTSFLPRTIDKMEAEHA